MGASACVCTVLWIADRSTVRRAGRTCGWPAGAGRAAAGELAGGGHGTLHPPPQAAGVALAGRPAGRGHPGPPAGLAACLCTAPLVSILRHLGVTVCDS